MSPRKRRRAFPIALALTAALLVGLLSPVTAGAAGPRELDLRIVTISDWHGQLDPIGGLGGAAALATYFKMERAGNPRTLVLTAGDAFGATPPLSNFFDDEPAVRAMRLMGIDADTLGNHNFDRGIAHLQSLIDIAGSKSEAGKPFPFLSANLENKNRNLRRVKDFEIFRVGGLKVAVIGVTNPEAPTLVFPGSFGSIVVTDPVAAAMAAKTKAARRGADVFVLLAHMGVTGFDIGGNPFGPLVDLANGVSGFDLIVGDHTNVQYNGTINDQLVVENLSKGVRYTRIDMTVQVLPNRSGRAVVGHTVTEVIPTAAAVTPDAAITALLDPLRTALSAILNTVVGESTVFIPRADSCGRSDGRLCESLVGNATTDSMRLRYGTDFAITNAGGLRADLTCPTVDNPSDFCPAYTPPNYPITSGQVLTVLPFGNQVVTVDITGAELKTYLENGVSVMPGANGRFAQVSGLCFTYDVFLAAGSRVTSVVYQNPDGTCSATPVDLTAGSTYSLATNDFVANGGDGYPNVASRMVTRELMDAVLNDYVVANTPISPTIQGRITCTTSGATACPVTIP